MENRTCLIILGMHRSGTSALAGFLHYLGINMGSELLEPAWDNPKGFYENKQVMEFNEYQLLPALNSTWDDITPINYSKIDTKKQEFYVKAKQIIIKNYENTEIFGIKDPRMCILFPFWEDVLLSLGIKIKVLFIYRNPLEVAFSLLYRNNFSLGKGLILWAKYNLYAEYYSRKYSRVFLNLDNILNNPEDLIKILKEDLSLPLSINNFKLSQALKFLTKDFKHYFFKTNHLSDTLPDFIKLPAIYLEKLSNKEIYFEEDLKEKFDRWRKSYETQLKDLHVDNLTNRLQAQIFFDTGGGFNEKESVIYNIKPIKSTQEIETYLPSNLKGLRFDPLNESCIVELINLELINEKEEINDVTSMIHSNAALVKENLYYFLDKDPQIYILDEIFKKKNNNFKIFKIKLKYISLGTKAELQTKLSQVEDELVRVYLSKSWRITRPLRWLRRKLRI